MKVKSDRPDCDGLDTRRGGTVNKSWKDAGEGTTGRMSRPTPETGHMDGAREHV